MHTTHRVHHEDGKGKTEEIIPAFNLLFVYLSIFIRFRYVYIIRAAYAIAVQREMFYSMQRRTGPI